ncbi:reprolysin-like metallopeptidase [Maribacter sp. 2304DJ31-5]|uniref:zinc-dependent metalloprotease n=1 Tax=Maribacter sp. 2304DJ31-5 TaxID=3386273 RepID=UPI0039BD4064
MITKLRLVFSITILFLSFSGVAQNSPWNSISLKSSERQEELRRWNVSDIKTFQLNERLFRSQLQGVGTQKSSRNIVFFPDETGHQVPFEIVEASVFSKELSAKYPWITSYKGIGAEDKGKKIRFSVSHKGIESMMTVPGEKGTLFMQKGKGGTYVLYNRKQHAHKEVDFVCRTAKQLSGEQSTLTARLVDDQTLRKFRVAISASGEYTAFHGGTKADALAAINATLTRVNEVFERDLAVTLELIGTTDTVIYTDSETDPYTDNLSSQTQNTLTNVIGESNYDIGHLFDQEDNTLDGNAGFIGAVCRDNRKGSAYSTFSAPEGDGFDIDLVAHEMGHQFGANHSWSHLSEGTTVQVEPASGTTIMGYAGITGINNVASNSDDYFHYVSIVQIRDYLRTVSCGEATGFSNNPPILDPVENFIIPRSTPFVLTGDATDADAGDVLTYAWEQIDNGIITQATFGPTNPTGAMFRSLPPVTVPERYFPNLDRILSGNLTQTNPVLGDAWETLSDVQRSLNFSLTVRDNALNGGQSVSDEVSVNVISSAGPFVVNSQSTASSYVAGEIQTVEWDVANTHVAPILAETVDILLSLDGGLTYPVTLAQNVLNDGRHDVIMPGTPTTMARIMVKPSNNIFFAVNTSNFTIVESEVVLNFPQLEYEACLPNDLVVIDFDYETYLGFTEESTFSVIAPPAGLGVAFAPVSATTDTDVSLTLTGISGLPVGTYPLRVTATSASFTKQVTIQLKVFDANFSEVNLISPANGLENASKDLVLEWQANSQNTLYDVEIATDSGFANVIESATVFTSTYPPNNLDNDTQYFWRVKPRNNCGEGTFGITNSFTTVQFNCTNKDAVDLPITIPSSGTPTITSKIAFFEDLPIADINVSLDIEHSFLSDLVISLTSPAGTTVVLTSSSCGSSRNINAVFDDDALPFLCVGNPAISGTVRPLGSLSSFNGESILGEWTLEIKDNLNSDGGRLNSFSLEVCVEGDFRPDDDNDGIFDDGDDLCLGTPEGQEVDASGCPVYRFPNENFSVSLQSESCRTSNDGQIQILPKIVLDYDIAVSGPGVDITQSFTDNFILSDLSAGTYTLCITGVDGAIVYEEHCLDVVIAEPDALSVTSKVSLDGKQVIVNLLGSDLYNLELNGQLVQTEASEITLDLEKGINFLKVSTNRSCQGTYEEQILFSSTPVVFPNPFTDVTNVFFGESDKTVEVSIFSSNGRLIMRDVREISGTQMELDFTQMAAGLYYIQFKGSSIIGTAKVIKR